MWTFLWTVYLLHQNVAQKSPPIQTGLGPESRCNGLVRQEKRFFTPQPSAKSWRKQRKQEGLGAQKTQQSQMAWDPRGKFLLFKGGRPVHAKGPQWGPRWTKVKEVEERLGPVTLISGSATSNVIKVQDQLSLAKDQKNCPSNPFNRQNTVFSPVQTNVRFSNYQGYLKHIPTFLD